MVYRKMLKVSKRNGNYLSCVTVLYVPRSANLKDGQVEVESDTERNFGHMVVIVWCTIIGERRGGLRGLISSKRVMTETYLLVCSSCRFNEYLL